MQRPILLMVFFLIGGSVLPVKAINTHIECPDDNGCQAMVKLMAAVSEISKKLDEIATCPGVNEKLAKQAEDLKNLKENLDENLASTKVISEKLEKLSADQSRHDEQIESPGAGGGAEKLLQSICGANFGPRDCTDVRLMGYNVSAKYRVYPGSDTRRIETYVYCDFSSSTESWLVIQRRIDGSENFDRNWRDYESGFGALEGEFWLGNDILSLLTMNKKYKLRIEMEDVKGVKRWAEYATFSVRPATDKYKLMAIGITGTAAPGDRMAFNNGLQFGTAVDFPKCFEPISGGWWFKGCMPGHPNARNGSIYWYHSGLSYHSLVATEMKIAAV